MLRKNRPLALLLVVAMAFALLAGCAPQPAQEPAPAPAENTPAPEPAPAATPAGPEDAAEREITDMAGRTVTIPAKIDSVFSAGTISAICLYMVAPDLMLNWNYELNEIERSSILEKYHSLPNMGMGDSINYEAVIAANPSIAVNVAALNDATIDQSNQMAEQLGIPVVVVSSKLDDAPAAFRFLGELLGVQEHAEQLAVYAETTFQDIAGANIPDDRKVRMYYGNGEDSLETAPAGSSHGQIMELVNATNVADLELGDGSRVRISLEQLLAWDPDVIVVIGEAKQSLSGGSAAQALLDNPDFATLKAVQAQQVYGAPNAPFSWVDRPMGPNRIIGMRWLAKLLYPDVYQYDLDEEVRKFFSLFYHIDLTDAQLQEVYHGFGK